MGQNIGHTVSSGDTGTTYIKIDAQLAFFRQKLGLGDMGNIALKPMGSATSKLGLKVGFPEKIQFQGAVLH